MNKGVFGVTSHLFAFFLLLLMFIIFITATKIIWGEKDQTIESREEINNKLILLNLVRQEIPEEKISNINYLSVGDTYLDFLFNSIINKGDFEFIFDGSLKEYRPRTVEGVSISYDYIVSLVEDIDDYENTIIFCQKKNCVPSADTCESHIMLNESKYLCLNYFTEKEFLEITRPRGRHIPE